MVWDVRTGRVVGDPLAGYADWVHSIALSPNGYELVFGSKEGTIGIWDIRARTDLLFYEEDVGANLDKERARIRWNASKAHMDESDMGKFSYFGYQLLPARCKSRDTAGYRYSCGPSEAGVGLSEGILV